MTEKPHSTGGDALAFLRSKWMGRLWLVVAVLFAFFLWQEVVGWPIKRHYFFGAESLIKKDSAVVEARLKINPPPGAWDTAFAKVTENRLLLPRYTTLDQLDTAKAGGCYIKGRSIYFRPQDASSLAPGQKAFIAQFPWNPSLGTFCTVTLLFFLCTGARWYARRKCPPAEGVLTRTDGSSPAGATTPRRHTFFKFSYLFCAASFAIAIGLRLCGFSFPAIFSDTKDYLKPGLLFAAGQRLIASPDRPFGYPLVLGLLLKVFADFRAVVVLQSLATLLTGAVICAILWKTGARAFRQQSAQSLLAYLAIFVTSLFTLSEAMIEREWAILPEAWATLYLGAQLWLAWSMTSRDLPAKSLILRYLAMCAAGCLLFFTKPNWAIALAALPIPLAAAGLLRRATWRNFLAWGGLGIAISLGIALLGMICQIWCTPGSAVGSLDQRARVLICWHAPMVRLELERRLHDEPNDKYHAALAEVAQVIDHEFALTKEGDAGAYPVLGYDADRLFYVGIKEARLYQKMPRPERTALFNQVFAAALRHHPGMYLEKVWSQFTLLFSRPYGALTAGPRGPTIIDRPSVQKALEFSEKYLANCPPYVPATVRERYTSTLAKARTDFDTPWPSVFRYGLSIRVSLIYETLRRPFPWMVGLSALICAAASLWPRWRTAVPWRALAPTLCVSIWSITSAMLSALTSSIAQALEIQRYIDLFLPLTLLSHFLWPILAIAVLASFPGSRSPIEKPLTSEPEQTSIQAPADD